ncbi:MAG: phosphate ABC transporter substrate-binding protein [Magnetococcales bacterium]|nr:phosphate ABC transporter substrate-binding protein [Magnetococcales bacterium]
MTVGRFILICTLGLAVFPGGMSLLWAEGDTVRIAGSSTMQPIVVEIAKTFTEKYKTWNTIDPALPSSPISIQTAAGGSSVGISATMDGTVQIGLASRPLNENEKQELGEHQAFLIGQDAVIIAAHPKNPLAGIKKSFTIEELRMLFSGEKHVYRDWDPTLPDQEIVLLSRDLDSGIAGVLNEQVLKGKPFAHHFKVYSVWPDLIRELLSSRMAISYVSAGIARQSDSLYLFAVEGVAATNEAILQSRYPLVRPLLMLVKGKPGSRVQAFIDHVLTEGQKVVAAHHFLPVSGGNGP